jgi:hypothetical protein
MAHKALEFLPKALQDEIAVNVLNSFNPQILDGIQKLADSQNISVNLKNEQ